MSNKSMTRSASTLLYKGRKLSASHQASLRKQLLAQESKSSLASKYADKYGRKMPDGCKKVNGRWARQGQSGDSGASLTRCTSTSVLETGQQQNGRSAAALPAGTADQSQQFHPKLVGRFNSDGDELPPTRTQLVEAYRTRNSQLDWVSIMSYNQQVAALDAKVEIEQAKKAKATFKMTLDQQLKEREALAETKAKAKQVEREKELAQFRKLLADEEANAARRKAKIMHEKDVRMQQMATNVARKQRAAEVRAEENAITVAKYKADSERQKKEAAERRRREKEKMERVKRENEITEQIKREERRRQDQEELERQAAYARQVAAAEAARAEYYEVKAKKQDANIAQLLKSTEEATKAAQVAEEKIRQAQEAFHRQQDELEAEKERQRQKMKEDIAIELKRQVDSRAEEKRRQVQLDMEYCEAVKATLAKIDAREAAETKARKQKLLEQNMFLGAQVVEIEQRKQKERAAMSDTEVKLNAHTLEKIKRHDVQPSTASGIRPRPY